MAGGISLYGDYCAMSTVDIQQDFTCASVGGEYDTGIVSFGVSYATALSFDPDLSRNTETMTLIGAYAQYALLDDDDFRIAAVLAYYDWAFAWTGGVEYLDEDATTVAIGGKLIAKGKPVGGSLLYLYGISNSITGEGSGIGTINSDDVAFSLLELKFTYAFGDAVSAYLVYRDVRIMNEPVNEDLSQGGFGVGLQVAF